MVNFSSKLPSSSVVGVWSTDTDDPDAPPMSVDRFQRKLWRVAWPHILALPQYRGGCQRGRWLGLKFDLCRIAETYVASSQSEAGATPIAETRKALDSLQKQAAAFQTALDSGPLINIDDEKPEKGKRPMRRYGADEFIEEFLAERNRFELRRVGFPHNPLDDPRFLGPRISIISELAGELVAACDYARMRLSEYDLEKYFAPGEAWNDFIKELAVFYRDLGGSISVTNYGPPSALTRFAFAVQCVLPERFWRHSSDSEDDPAADGEPPPRFTKAVQRATDTGTHHGT